MPSVERAVMAALDGFVASTIRVNDPPDVNHPDLERFRTGAVLQNAVASVHLNQIVGIGYRLPAGSVYSHTPTIKSIGDATAVVLDCVVDDAQQVSVLDGHVLNDSVATKLFETTLVLDRRRLEGHRELLAAAVGGRDHVRTMSFVALLGLFGLLVGAASEASAEIGDHTGGSGGGAVIVGGTPIAIAVVAPSGTLASYTRKGGGSGPRWTCGYFGLENGSTSGISINIDYSTGPLQPVRNEPYAFICRDQRGQVVHSWFGVYDPGDPLAGLFAAERAAELALERLELADPVVRLNPPGDQLVGMPSWLWIDTPWVPSDVSASVTGVTATVTATPRRVDWDTGDGAALSCAGPGVGYDPNRGPESQSSDCTHTYIWPSSTQPGGVYSVRATVTYTVSWVATDGGGGDLGAVTRTSTVPVRVVEVQAVID